jgi:predicted nucleotidyltransferase
MKSPEVPAAMIARIVDELHPDQLWLFGSRARGEAHEWSDWDFLAVVPDSSPDADLDTVEVWRRLRDLRLQRVEVFTMRRAEFEEWRRSLGTLAEIVASTGSLVHGG